MSTKSCKQTMNGSVKIVSTENPAEPQCQFFVQRKKRLCRMTVKPGKNFCGEHEPAPSDAGDQDLRVPCPLDPKHTCYASKLEKHVQVCNSRRGALPEYYEHNVNAAATGTPPSSRLPLSKVPRAQLFRVIEKVNRLYDSIVEQEISSAPEQSIHWAVQAEFAAAGRAESSRRHLRQASALLRLCEDEGMVADGTCYVELGAGKGHLSYFAWLAWCSRQPASRALLLDRAALRHKRDNKLRGGRAPQPADLAPPTPQSHADRVTSPGEVAAPSPQPHADRVTPPGEVAAPSPQPHADRVTPPGEVAAPSPQPHADRVTPPGEVAAPSPQPHADRVTPPGEVAAPSPQPHADRVTPPGEVAAPSPQPHADRVTPPGEVAAPSPQAPVRLRADLAHVALQRVPCVAQCARAVGLAKHLCGVATDYALRCMTSEGARHKTRGIVLATCCHHRCERAAYFGSDELLELGITGDELDVIFGIVSWATCGDGRSRERRLREAAAADAGNGTLNEPGDEHGSSGDEDGSLKEAGTAGDAGRRLKESATNGVEDGGLQEQERPGDEDEGRLTYAEKEEVGRRAKALADWARAAALRRRGLRARLVRFVPRQVSPEDLAIVAHRHH